jgi:hypothetical protein
MKYLFARGLHLTLHIRVTESYVDLTLTCTTLLLQLLWLIAVFTPIFFLDSASKMFEEHNKNQFIHKISVVSIFIDHVMDYESDSLY